MQIWSGTLSPFSAKVRMLCAEKQIPADIHDVKWTRSTLWQKPQAFLDVAPRGQVPVLIDADLIICDSTVINEYLEERYPEPALLPADLTQRAKARYWEDEADFMMGDHITTLIRESYVPNDNPDQEALKVSHAALADYADRLVTQLGEDDYLVGSYSVADIATFVCLGFSQALGADLIQNRPTLQAWWQRMYERPAVREDFENMMAVAAGA